MNTAKTHSKFDQFEMYFTTAAIHIRKPQPTYKMPP